MSSYPAGLTVCYSDISGIGGLDFSTTIEYKSSWNTFQRIEQYNFNVSTARSAGDTAKTYYQYMDNAERMAYIRGLNLHTTYAGYSTVVKKN
jgi:hypothetical protein